jgi:hypothetical protein
MTYLKISISILTLVFLASCNMSESVDSQVSTDSLGVINSDTIVNEVVVDTVSTLHDSLVKDGYVEETKALATVIEKKFGTQWDFCDCVVKNDSINKVMSDLDDVSDEQVDVIFARWDVIEQHCKELTTAPNTTPDERSKYARKVKRCLRNAGIK